MGLGLWLQVHYGGSASWCRLRPCTLDGFPLFLSSCLFPRSFFIIYSHVPCSCLLVFSLPFSVPLFIFCLFYILLFSFCLVPVSCSLSNYLFLSYLVLFLMVFLFQFLHILLLSYLLFPYFHYLFFLMSFGPCFSC